MSIHKRILFVFRQDLRVSDNTALWHAAHDGHEIVPIFVFDKRIISECPTQDKRLGFLIDACKQLDAQLQDLGSRLHVFYDNPETLIPTLITKHKCDALYMNTSYGPGSLHRDKILAAWTKKNGIVYQTYSDFLLVEPHVVEQRKVFTSFYNLRKKQLIQLYPGLDTTHKIYTFPTPDKIQTPTISHVNDPIYASLDAGINTYRPVDWAKKRMKSFALDTYENSRNMLDIDGTTRLSPYMRFGLVSIRALFNRGVATHIACYGPQAGNVKNAYISELAWREFWYHIMYCFPETQFVEFQEKRRHIQRSQDEDLLHKREMGQTGYPIVDAAMQQLRQENRMHGRARMVVASFLTKDMLIDWRLGERIFAKYLLDYDFAVNIGNWQWSASVGADPKPLRIFNPILQSQKFDPDATYIKKHIPSLQNESLEAIHDPIHHKLGYVDLIVDHYAMSQITKKAYRHD